MYPVFPKIDAVTELRISCYPITVLRVTVPTLQYCQPMLYCTYMDMYLRGVCQVFNKMKKGGNDNKN